MNLRGFPVKYQNPSLETGGGGEHSSGRKEGLSEEDDGARRGEPGGRPGDRGEGVIRSRGHLRREGQRGAVPEGDVRTPASCKGLSAGGEGTLAGVAGSAW